MPLALLAVADTASSYAGRAHHKSNDVYDHLWRLFFLIVPYSTPYSTHCTRPSSSLPSADILLLTFNLHASIDIFISAAVLHSSTFILSVTDSCCTPPHSFLLRNGMASSAGGVAVVCGFMLYAVRPKPTGRDV
ncbi:unnamed protein product [Haemonchus placei]|uniref:Secreted peptide n=1 Tax=Haemonchus placei TaxID=6290 RepID=A0A0N4WHC0_HAEPC|nr:unnamed protein product [Haemonchus placei]